MESGKTEIVEQVELNGFKWKNGNGGVEQVESGSSGVGGTSANSGNSGMTDGSSSSPGAFFQVIPTLVSLDHHQILLGLQ